MTISGPTAPSRWVCAGARGPPCGLPADHAHGGHRLHDGRAADRVDHLAGLPTGPAAEPLLRRGQNSILGAAIESLANALKLNRRSIQRRIVASFVADWQSDPYALGAYSYVPVNAMAAPMTLAQPVENTLFFAGEATNSDGASGTMHGAIATGYRAAEELLSVERQAA